MSEPIKPLDLPLDLSSFDGRGDLSEDQLYAPADVSEIPSFCFSGPETSEAALAPEAPQHPEAVRGSAMAVSTLTNSPGCAPSDQARPIRRARRVRTDAWSASAPANWGRARRPVRKVPGRGRPNRSVNAMPSTDWSLPF